jgi:hypothetical protein
VAFPVVAVDAVSGIEDALLLEKALAPDGVVDEARQRAERPEGLGALTGSRVARDDVQVRREGRVRAELGLDAELLRAVGCELAEAAERAGDAVSVVREAPADDLLERVEPELGLDDDAEVAASSAQPPEQLGS